VAKRPMKFYFKNEREVMLDLGLKPAKGSGSGWIEKEDGENDYVLAQLKSTDANSIRIRMLDIEKLEAHANTSHKIPVFIVQFLKSGDLFFMARPLDLPALAKYIETGKCKAVSSIEIEDKPVNKPTKVISSGSKNRSKFWNEKAEQREKVKQKWRK